MLVDNDMRNIKIKNKFFEKAKKVHGDKYDYSLVEYVNAKTKVKIICPKHGVFEQVPDSHIRNHGCKYCNGGTALNTNSFVERAIKIHGNKYDYSKVKYINNRTKINLICKEHGEFLQSPMEHLSSYGCWNCGILKRSKSKTSNVDEFIKKSILKHGNKYNYSKTKYKNSKTKVEIICKNHGSFFQTCNSHLSGSGCPVCGESKGEKKIGLFLEKNKLNFDKQKTFDDCIGHKSGRKLPFDFYINKYNICIEYDGEYHFKPWRLYFDKNKAEDKFNELKIRDEIKTKYCEKKGINLLRISYFEIKNIDKIISNYLLKTT